MIHEVARYEQPVDIVARPLMLAYDTFKLFEYYRELRLIGSRSDAHNTPMLKVFSK